MLNRAEGVMRTHVDALECELLYINGVTIMYCILIDMKYYNSKRLYIYMELVTFIISNICTHNISEICNNERSCYIY